MNNPWYKLYKIPSIFSNWKDVSWDIKVIYCLSPSDANPYRLGFTPGEQLIKARADINYAIEVLEAQLARVREADSIVRELEDWEKQYEDDD
jgi:hypothetical protein